MSACTVAESTPVEPSLRLGYPERSYQAADLSELFSALDSVWRSTCRLANWERLLDLRPAGRSQARHGRGAVPAVSAGAAAWWGEMAEPTDRPWPTARSGPGLSAEYTRYLGSLIKSGEEFSPPALVIRSVALGRPLELVVATAPGLVNPVGALGLLSGLVREPDRCGARLARDAEAWCRPWLTAEVSGRKRARIAAAVDAELDLLARRVELMRRGGWAPHSAQASSGAHLLAP